LLLQIFRSLSDLRNASPSKKERKMVIEFAEANSITLAELSVLGGLAVNDQSM
jgi:hypothetical protein